MRVPPTTPGKQANGPAAHPPQRCLAATSWRRRPNSREPLHVQNREANCEPRRRASNSISRPDVSQPRRASLLASTFSTYRLCAHHPRPRHRRFYRRASSPVLARFLHDASSTCAGRRGPAPCLAHSDPSLLEAQARHRCHGGLGEPGAYSAVAKSCGLTTDSLCHRLRNATGVRCPCRAPA